MPAFYEYKSRNTSHYPHTCNKGQLCCPVYLLMFFIFSDIFPQSRTVIAQKTRPRGLIGEVAHFFAFILKFCSNPGGENGEKHHA